MASAGDGGKTQTKAVAAARQSRHGRNVMPAAEQASRIWSTETAAPAEGLSYWVDAICEAFLEMKADSTRREGFRGRLAQHDFGPVDLNFVTADAQQVWRTRRAAAGSARENFYLLQMRRGRLQVAQQGREVWLQPGDCALVDSRQPYGFDFPADFDCLSVQIPAGWLRTWLPAPERLTAMSLGAASGWGATLCSLAANLRPEAVEGMALPRDIVAGQLGALLALAGGHDVTAGSAHRQALLDRLRAGLRDRLHESDLDPAALAAQHGLSKRYLHALFAAAGSSFGAELVEQRLVRAAALLADRRFAALSIAEIAWRCGFAEPSHFARRFRARHGLPPAAWRQLRLHG